LIYRKIISLLFEKNSIQHFNFIELDINIKLNDRKEAYFPFNIPRSNYKFDVTLNLKNNNSNQIESIYHISLNLI
jgi:ribosomal protein S8